MKPILIIAPTERIAEATMKAAANLGVSLPIVASTPTEFWDVLKSILGWTNDI